MAKLAGTLPPGKELERIYRRKDGTIFPVLVEDRLILDEKGCINGVRCTIQDITGIKKAEEALQRSEETAKRLAQENATMAEIGRIISSTLNIDEVYEHFAEEVRRLIAFDRVAINTVTFADSTLVINYVSGVEVEDHLQGDLVPLSGTTAEEVIRTRSSVIIQGKDENEIADRFPGLSNALRAGLQSIIVVPLVSKKQVIGILHFASAKLNAYTETDLRLAERVGNQIAGAIANAQLFAERVQAEQKAKSLEEQLHQSQKMEAIGRLAGGIAHDFNNLLTVIKGYSQLSLLDLQKDNPLRGNIEEIQKASQRAADLTSQLLAFSRRQILDLKVLDLNALLRNLDKMLHRLIGEDIELVTALGPDLGKVKTDPGQIEQMIMNLAVNARDAMPSGGKLTIETADVELDEAYARDHIAVKPGRYVMLSVSDTGCGMSPKVRERVFEPFFTTKEIGKGTGLGLSTVYGIVKQSEGSVWVYSEPGRGTTFKIYLPRVDEPLEAKRDKVAGEKLTHGSETILVVEDEEAVRTLAVRILERHGYIVLEACNGGEALCLCEQRKGPVHLILTDVVMPEMSGRQLVDQFRQVWQDSKVLYMSGYTDNTIVSHGVLEEGVNYIQKPFTPDALARKVHEVLNT
jgi:signal transduction histidine kinase